MKKIATLATAAFLLPAVAGAAQQYKHCPALSFPGRTSITITNVCSLYIYVTWDDDAGEHITAVGPNSSITTTYKGRPAVTGVDTQ